MKTRVSSFGVEPSLEEPIAMPRLARLPTVVEEIRVVSLDKDFNNLLLKLK